MYGDYHTHTVFSHGSGSVRDNVSAAAALGLKEIAITDHGFGHLTYGVRRRDFSALKTAVMQCRDEFPSVKTLVGLETNLMDYDGRVDLSEEEAAALDVMICGYHKVLRPGSPRSLFGFKIPVFMCGLAHKSSAKRVVMNTDAYIKAMQRYPIDIISHPNHGMKVDLKELASAAAHYGVLLELNGKKISFDKDAAAEMLACGANFIVDSDAHSPSRVGEIGLPQAFIAEAGIPSERIANMDKRPIFRREMSANATQGGKV